MIRKKQRTVKERSAPYRSKTLRAKKTKNSSEHLQVIEKQFRLSSERVAQLDRFAKLRAVTEDEIVAKALDILFSLTDSLDERIEQKGWSFLSEESLKHLWDNNQDAVYDNWRELYGVPAR